ncbi:hypothetical protein MPDQ_006883 [Monascus purpureus]|uniref:Peptidase S54 rhomboid domain-containing protein n=1 Tax=Monascus purpureus TaxID=5098 RepID=A0A507QVF4_MONPU|nr:hypothetical protein MPDQ_006883 [Monascus purpureus]BDD55052.1 hypothetical protein MAP00_000607 [Monascus purpureus]
MPVRAKPFSAAEIRTIFGRRKVSGALGNRILSVLHGRRLSGTLDLDLPADITSTVPQSTLDAGLKWLRTNYPIDEDAAILARIEREELEEEQRLIRRAEELGLYKPQSGSFGAERSEEDGVWGKSILKNIRRRNEARLLAEEEQRRKEWLEGEQREREALQRQIQQNTSLQKFEGSAVVDARPRADPKERPVLAWAQKHYLRAMDNDYSKLSEMTTSRRLVPALIVTLITLGLCYIYAESYQPPQRSDRMWPNVYPAAATAIAMIGINVGICILWKCWPPSWRMLNRYFISVPVYPHPLSLVGSIFSHQTFKHLAVNMTMLWFIGTRLHDEIGRGSFIAVYLACGVVGSMASLTAHVLLGKLMVTSLGASGALTGLIAAWCMLHADDKLTFFFLPPEWRDTFSAPGWVALTGIVTLEVLGLLSPFPALRVASLDYYAHLGGYLTGALWAVAWKAERAKKQKENRPWLEKVFYRE